MILRRYDMEKRVFCLMCIFFCFSIMQNAERKFCIENLAFNA